MTYHIAYVIFSTLYTLWFQLNPCTHKETLDGPQIQESKDNLGKTSEQTKISENKDFGTKRVPNCHPTIKRSSYSIESKVYRIDAMVVVVCRKLGAWWWWPYNLHGAGQGYGWSCSKILLVFSILDYPKLSYISNSEEDLIFFLDSDTHLRSFNFRSRRACLLDSNCTWNSSSITIGINHFHKNRHRSPGPDKEYAQRVPIWPFSMCWPR